MNVLYVHDRPSGGAGESLYQLVRGRAEAGAGRSLLFFGESGFVAGRFAALGLEPPPRYSYMRPWMFYRPEARTLRSWLRFAGSVPLHARSLGRLLRTARRGGAELVHTNCIYLADGALAARLLGLPHVWQVRELLDLDYYAYPIDKRWLVRVLQRGASAVLCNSRRTAAGLERLGADPAGLRVIHNIVDEPARRIDLRARLGVGPDVLLVGTVGWITPNKRVEDFIELAGRLGDLGDRVRFAIIGGWGGKSAYDDKIRAALAASPNRARILHLGIVEDAPAHLASLDLLVCPCWTESFGRTVGEALAVGVPAIGVRDTAVAEIIDDGESGFLVDRGDVAAMEQHARTLLASAELRRRFGEQGRAEVRRRFSSAALLPRYEELYRELASGRARAGRAARGAA